MDQQALQTEFDKTSEELISLLSSFDQEQINVKPTGGGWSAAQVGDHLLQSYGVADTLKGKVSETTRPAGEKAEILKSIFLDFSTKFESPDFIIPTEKPIDKNQLLQGLREQFYQMRQVLTTEDLSLTCHDFVLPQIGELTRYEWLVFVMVHTQRHIHQIKQLQESKVASVN